MDDRNGDLLFALGRGRTREGLSLSFERLFHPQGIAIIGASADITRIGSHPIKALKNAGYKGGIFPINPKYPELHGLKCYPDVMSLTHAVRAGGGGRARARRRPGHPRLRQGRHPVRGGADRRLSRDREPRGASWRRSSSARWRESGRAHRRPQLPGHALRPGAGVGRVRQRLRRDRAAGPAACRAPSSPAASAMPSSTSPRRRAWAFAIASPRATRSDITTPELLSAFLDDPGTSLAFAYLEGTPDARRLLDLGRKSLRDRQAGADLEGRHHRCRHQGRRLAHRQHDRQLRPLPRGDAPVRPDRGGRRRAHRRHRQAVRAGAAAQAGNRRSACCRSRAAPAWCSPTPPCAAA